MPSIDLDGCILSARSYEGAHGSNDEDDAISTTTTTTALRSPGPGGDASSSASSYTPDLHAVFNADAQLYYAGLHSGHTLLYRTGKEQWSSPRGPEAQRRLKKLHEDPIVKVWNLFRFMICAPTIFTCSRFSFLWYIRFAFLVRFAHFKTEPWVPCLLVIISLVL